MMLDDRTPDELSETRILKSKVTDELNPVAMKPRSHDDGHRHHHPILPNSDWNAILGYSSKEIFKILSETGARFERRPKPHQLLVALGEVGIDEIDGIFDGSGGNCPALRG